jgi:hypothetical protein
VKYIILLVFCLFMGVTGISLGVGTVVPAINTIAKPLVCPDGEMVSQTTTRQGRRAGSTIIEANWTCVSPAGATPISLFEIALIAGSVHGLILFVVFGGLMALRGGSVRQR